MVVSYNLDGLAGFLAVPSPIAPKGISGMTESQSWVLVPLSVTFRSIMNDDLWAANSADKEAAIASILYLQAYGLICMPVAASKD